MATKIVAATLGEEAIGAEIDALIEISGDDADVLVVAVGAESAHGLFPWGAGGVTQLRRASFGVDEDHEGGNAFTLRGHLQLAFRCADREWMVGAASPPNPV